MRDAQVSLIWADAFKPLRGDATDDQCGKLYFSTQPGVTFASHVTASSIRQTDIEIESSRSMSGKTKYTLALLASGSENPELTSVKLNKPMGFTAFVPCDALKPYIERFVISENTSESVYKVLPGAGIVMGFQFGGQLYHIVDGKEKLLSRSGVTGIIDSYRIFKNSNDIKTVLVFFKDGGAAAFFRDPMHELFQSSVSLDNFILRTELLIFEEQLYEAKTYPDKIRIVELFLLGRRKVPKHDLIVSQALELIYKSKGNIPITDLCKHLNISQSPLEKRFRKVIGASPKKFATIVRFKSLIHDVSLSSSLTALAYESGYYDQSHFIKEFKKFTGDTPNKYFDLK